LALGGRCWLLKHNNQPIFGGSNKRDDERMHGRGGVYGGGVFLFRGGELNDKKKYRNKIQQRP
jgi:hypothetical protein